MPTSSAPRGCLLFLVQTAASMARPIPVLGGLTGMAAVGRLIGNVLSRLATLSAQGALGTGGWDVAVVGYGGAGEPPLRCLLAGGSDDRPFVPLETLAVQGGRVPLQAPVANGPGGAAGLARASLLLQSWMISHDSVLQPLIVYCTDEQGLDSGLMYPGLLMRVHCTPRGPVMLATCGFTPALGRGTAMPCSARAVTGDPWQTAWAYSSRLPTTGTEKHALSINDLSPTMLVRVVRLLSRQGSGAAPPWKLGGDKGTVCEARVLWAPKAGNADEEYEDSFAVDAGTGRAVIADGATQGIFARLWAGLLTQSFLQRELDLTDPEATAGWLADCRREWRSRLRYDDLHGLQQDKVDEVGAAATLLALSVHKVEDRYRWRAAVLGDSCLFWMREGTLLAALPLCRSVDFSIAPDLVPTVRRFAPQVRFITAEGPGKPGDLYGLATDAVAQYLLQSLESEQSLDLARYWQMDAATWRQELHRLRQQRRIVNDDSTLVLLWLKE